MVTLGATDTGTLTINLERIGLLALGGDPERAAGVLRRMAFELGAPFLAAVVNVVLSACPRCPAWRTTSRQPSPWASP